MEKLKDRKSNMISKRKIVTAINLFETYIDEEIESIEIYGGNYYRVITKNNKNYSVDIGLNKVEIICRDCYDD